MEGLLYSENKAIPFKSVAAALMQHAFGSYCCMCANRAHICAKGVYSHACENIVVYIYVYRIHVHIHIYTYSPLSSSCQVLQDLYFGYSPPYRSCGD